MDPHGEKKAVAAVLVCVYFMKGITILFLESNPFTEVLFVCCHIYKLLL